MWQVNFVVFLDIFCIAKRNKVILLQSVTGCYNKVRQVLIRICDMLLLQSASDITQCDRLYYKLRHVLQSETVITKRDLTVPRKAVHPKIQSVPSFIYIFS